MLKLAPFLLQGAFMLVDEFYCHRRRVMRRWERIGHPLDTASFALCLGLLLVLDHASLWVYVLACVGSCALITKDEWEHRELSDGFENWLHAVLFMLHPVVLIWAGYLWWTGDLLTVKLALFLSVGFFLYQLVYWNMVRRDQQ